jgi:hypothetical protein
MSDKPEKYIDNFLACVLVQLLFPLVPIAIELIIKSGTVSESSFYLVSAMYSFTVGTSSNGKSLFLSGAMISVFSFVLFGVSLSSDSNMTLSQTTHIIVLLGLLFVFVTNIFNRYNLHVQMRVPYGLWD